MLVHSFLEIICGYFPKESSVKNSPCGSHWQDPCFDHFWAQKVIFQTFSKLFCSCIEVVWASFSASKVARLGVFLARHIINDLENGIFRSNSDPLRSSFLTIFGVKKAVFLAFSQLFRSYFESIWDSFRPYKAHFFVYFQLERLINSLKN